MNGEKEMKKKKSRSIHNFSNCERSEHTTQTPNIHCQTIRINNGKKKEITRKMLCNGF